MKKRVNLRKRHLTVSGLLLLVMMIAVFIFSCNVESVTKEQRVNLFCDELNTASRSGIRDHFTVPGTIDADSVGAGTLLDPAYRPFSVSNLNIAGDTVTCTISRSGSIPVAATFVMSDIGLSSLLGGENWKIASAGFTDGLNPLTLP
jgi:hypothetical protein